MRRRGGERRMKDDGGGRRKEKREKLNEREKMKELPLLVIEIAEKLNSLEKNNFPYL